MSKDKKIGEKIGSFIGGLIGLSAVVLVLAFQLCLFVGSFVLAIIIAKLGFKILFG